MPLNAEALRKILALEQKKGYLDTSVIGGLDKFLQHWVVQAAGSVSEPGLLQALQQLHLSDGHYAILSKDQRQQYVANILSFITLAADGTQTTEVSSQKSVVRPPATVPSTRTKKMTVTPIGSIDSPITVIKGINTAQAEKFNKLGVSTIRDLLYFFPHRHLDYTKKKTVSQLVAGEDQTIIANVWEARISMPGGRKSTEATICDETGCIRTLWFNQPYVVKQLRANAQIVVSGRVSSFHNQMVFESPEFEPVENSDSIHTGRLVPVYSLTQGLYPRSVRKLMKQTVDEWAPQLTDFLPLNVKSNCNLLELSEAICQAHYPDDDISKDEARIRLAFDELFLLQLGVQARKRDWQQIRGIAFKTDLPVVNRFIASLPFKLTGAQNRVLKEILDDAAKPVPMSRLLQGEVGSGKTVIAATALLTAVANGYQGALMAPTEILAEQHFRTIHSILCRSCEVQETDDNVHVYQGLLPQPLTVALLIGDIKGSKKKALQKRIESGEINIAIGTHALVQKDVSFDKLGLVVVDEQHRFGVNQRSALRQKGSNPHVLVMTATPIPRTLAMTLYGDLDLSVIDQLPPGRQIIKTKWLRPDQRESAYAFLRKQITAGRQAFIICPLVEESEAIQARAAVAEYEHLSREIFPDLKLGLLHGRMSAADKDEVMRRFHDGQLNILVSTAVVEVGIDVPNATVMLVEGADRFGLSQLHQFRGRVGRGAEQSYCILLAENPSPEGQERLKLIENTNDGFQLAEADLRLRGPGEFFGVRQSGLPDLRMARLSDVKLLEMARNEALKLFQVDPNLTQPEHQPLAKELARAWQKAGEQS